MSESEGTLAVSIKEAAKLLSVSESTVKRLIRSKQLKFKRIGRSVRVLKSSIQSYLGE